MTSETAASVYFILIWTNMRAEYFLCLRIFFAGKWDHNCFLWQSELCNLTHGFWSLAANYTKKHWLTAVWPLQRGRRRGYCCTIHFGICLRLKIEEKKKRLLLTAQYSCTNLYIFVFFIYSMNTHILLFVFKYIHPCKQLIWILNKIRKTTK